MQSKISPYATEIVMECLTITSITLYHLHCLIIKFFSMKKKTDITLGILINYQKKKLIMRGARCSEPKKLFKCFKC